MQDDTPRRDGPWVALAVLGGVWLALYLGLSLWVFLSHVGPSLRIEHAAVWVPGQATPLSVELRGPDRVAADLPESGLRVALTHASGTGPARVQSLGGLKSYVMRKGQDPTRAQGQIAVPPNWPLGTSRLDISFVQSDGSTLTRSCDIEVASQLGPRRPARAIEHSSFVQQANQSQAQPKGYWIHLVPASAMRPGLENRFWLQVIDDHGKPVKGRVQVQAVAGTFRSSQPLPTEALPATGLLRFEGQVHSETVTFSVKVWPQGPSKAKASPIRRKIQIRAFPGASTLEAKIIPGKPPVLATRYLALSKRRRASLDLYDNQGHWLAVVESPQWPSSTWQRHGDLRLPAGALQIEAYAGVRRLEPDTPSARVWVPKAGQDPLPKLVDIMRARVPRLPKAARPSLLAYLDHVRAQAWDSSAQAQLTQWLSQALPLAHYAGPVVHDTHAHAAKELAEFRAAWTLRLRLLLWGGGLAFTVLVSLCLLRAHRARMAAAQDEVALALVPTSDIWGRVLGVVLVLVGCMALLSMLMENLVAT